MQMSAKLFMQWHNCWSIWGYKHCDKDGM